ncbi:bifunctional UDP-N-acetylmuramoyl-tripeptide:D-alanyl-D-alanine ligase/alanine racemase [Prolixibacter sp. SD074]|uniref:bifunctional UDP-N-acetylmuramoyl-tripeptide:D-alanyl-D-alanine ligase/alanine racemase n=1 Tax=Prolixibacter sp. SD074 TaxID=2652391 RepID=UPI001278D8DA|nr:bifunctional UDP-N-acetylmuramoyl-tripeptide:D-alanyl-D-alanine ligase/alanine racemase [Prolixibacter sp. SD074]GET29983.1 bifunctional UDP-N-acetylmuramoyl-tripeptide:D-alanyl-D-alanine ligase/alanine racemase [Prolixibacter sp. SD074]
MTAYPLKEVSEITNGNLNGNNGGVHIRFLSFDSRTVLAGPETLFFALRGNLRDGHQYVRDAYLHGVRAFVVEEIPAGSEFTEAAFIQVPDSLEALQKLATYHRNRFSYPVLGITGSNGKTIVKEWLSELMAPEHKIIRSPRSYNSQIGNPLSVWLMDEQFNLAIFEAGISMPGEMEKLENLLHPEWGVFTHLGQAHLENFRNQRHLVKEKLQLFNHSKHFVYCSDFDELQKAVTTKKTEGWSADLFRWSREDESADLFIGEDKRRKDGSQIDGIFNGSEMTIFLPFTDDAYVENGIHCWATMLAMGYKPGSFEGRFARLAPVAMRLELKKGQHGAIVIDDSYNSDTGSLLNALDFLRQQAGNSGKRSTVILSDILQSGIPEEQLYGQVAEYLALRKVDRFVGIGPKINRYQELFPVGDKAFYNSTEDFLQHLNGCNFHDEVILLKGARTFRFDLISGMLQEKVHQTVLEINMSALAHNLKIYRQKLKPETQIMAMVKAFSYGTGSTEVARVLQFHRADYLAVAIADEGVALRREGIGLPIVVMNPEEHSFDAMIGNRLEPNIYRLELLKSFEAALHRNAMRNFPIHVKLDTGMKRLGFETEEHLKELVAFVQARDTIYIRSIFSHLAVSDEPVEDSFTDKQFERFEVLGRIVADGFDYKILKHILNSAGIERFPGKQYDMVRLGIGLYGVSSFVQNELQNVATLRTTISQIRTVQAGETIGYGRKGVAKENMQIAVLPIGYADGFNRLLSNGVGKVSVKGTKVPVVGNICMDMCMVDVTGLDVEEGDRVIVFGEEIPVGEVAEELHTIPYEVLTSVGQRVKRVYFEE